MFGGVGLGTAQGPILENGTGSGSGVQGFGFRFVAVRESYDTSFSDSGNHMDKKMENDMETGIWSGLIRVESLTVLTMDNFLVWSS